MLSQEFRDFYANWRQKAEGYVDDGGIQWAFDRFFTLYVIYNRLYAELTFEMARAGTINLEKRDRFPDAEAAKDYVRQRIGCRTLMELLDKDPDCSGAIQAVIELLTGPVEDRQFAINLRMIDGETQRDEDIKHLAKFQSHNSNERAEAVLQFIYAVRCNLFHGHKSFERVQLAVIRPANVLLRRITDILFERLDQL
jgi:hypothetical protein